MALESYLERTNLRLPPSLFQTKKDNLSTRQREALKILSTNKEINLKKAEKGTTTVVMDTRQKIQEGLEQVPTGISINLFRATGLILKWPLQNAHFSFQNFVVFPKYSVYIYIYIYQHCTDEAQKAETVLSAVRYSSLVGTTRVDFDSVLFFFWIENCRDKAHYNSY